MRVIITGASGFVGQQLIPLLKARNVDVVAIGRSANWLQTLFPDTVVGVYDDIPILAEGADMLVHLAVANNNQSLSAEEFKATNVDLALSVAAMAKRANISTFINVSSVHVLDVGKSDFYADTKRQAITQLESQTDIAVHTLILPLVYGDKFTGTMQFMNKLPALVSRVSLPVLAALKPTVHVEKIADWLCNFSAPSPQKATILTNDMDQNLIYRVIKRLIDIAFVVFVFICLGWLLIGVWIAIKLTSEGPGLFSQTRVGKNRTSFVCRKFRTMKPNTAQVGTHEVSESAVTGIGNYLRKLKLDELPQAWNILMGDLTLIGPRPCLPVQDLLIQERDNRGIFDIRPGISGLAQVKGVDMSDPVALAELDAQYVALRSVFLDLKLILSTATGKGFGDRTSVDT